MPFWLGGAVVALVVMSYVFFGGMRGTAWVNTFQTVLFLGLRRDGGGGDRDTGWAASARPSEAMLALARHARPCSRASASRRWYFFSYTFIPLSAIAFPHITIFCLTARKHRRSSRRR